MKINHNNIKTYSVLIEGTTALRDFFQKEIYEKRKKNIPSKAAHVDGLLYNFQTLGSGENYS